MSVIKCVNFAASVLHKEYNIVVMHLYIFDRNVWRSEIVVVQSFTYYVMTNSKASAIKAKASSGRVGNG